MTGLVGTGGLWRRAPSRSAVRWLSKASLSGLTVRRRAIAPLRWPSALLCASRAAFMPASSPTCPGQHRRLCPVDPNGVRHRGADRPHRVPRFLGNLLPALFGLLPGEPRATRPSSPRDGQPFTRYPGSGGAVLAAGPSAHGAAHPRNIVAVTHLEENPAAAELVLDEAALVTLDQAACS